MTIATKIRITSECPDFEGFWRKRDVEQDMRDLDCAPISGSWIEWILEHVFDGELDADIEKVLVANTIFGKFHTVVDGSETEIELY